MEDEMFSLKLKKGLAQRERTVQNFIENDTLWYTCLDIPNISKPKA